MSRKAQTGIIVITITLLIVFLCNSIYLQYTNNELIKDTAQTWYKAITLADYQTAINFTCSAKVGEINNIIDLDSNIFITDSNISDIKFSIAESDKNFAVIDARGKVSVEGNGVSYSWDLNNRWLFFKEGEEWKWCGALIPSDDVSLSDTTLIIIGGSALIFILIAILFSGRQTKEDDFSQFISISEEDINDESLLSKAIDYESGKVKSFNKRTGVGMVETAGGEIYVVNQKSIIGKGDKSLDEGEDILFQKNWEAKEKKAKNIVKVTNQSKELSHYSKWLLKLALKTKQLRTQYSFSSIKIIQKELNTCKSWLDILNDMAKNDDVKLAPHEVILTNVIKNDLNKISKRIEAYYKKSSIWAQILGFVLQLLSVLADFIQVASPGTALLLKSIGRSITRMLGKPKDPPSLGPGDE